MASTNPIIVGGGMQAGPITLGEILYVSNVSPPQASSFAPKRLLDGGVVYLGIPNSSGVYPSTAGATETLRVNGGAIITGSGTDSVQIGRGSNASQTNSIAIGTGAVANSPNTTVIGASTNNGQQGVVIGHASGFNSCSGVAIGNAAVANGNAGGAAGVVVGPGSTLNLSSAGGGTGVVIGPGASASAEDVVIGGNASSNQNSSFGVGSVVIGTGATANIAGGTVYAVVIGWSASSAQKLATVIGSGASASGGAQTRAVVIGSGASASATDAIVIGGGSALSSVGITIGAGGSTIAPNVAQIGTPGTPITTVVFGQGDTSGAPPARTLRCTNAAGTNVAAGSLTIQAPLSTGNATPASIIFNVGVAGASGSSLQTATTILTLTGASAVVGTDPGGSDLLRVGGAAAVGGNFTAGVLTASAIHLFQGGAAAGNYIARVLANAGAARDVFAAQVSGVSNGFQVQFSGSAMAYTFATAGGVGDTFTVYPAATFNGPCAINGKTPVSSVAAPTAAGATYGANEQTLLNDIRTRLINFGVYT